MGKAKRSSLAVDKDVQAGVLIAYGDGGLEATVFRAIGEALDFSRSVVDGDVPGQARPVESVKVLDVAGTREVLAAAGVVFKGWEGA